jgi:hypothetical protein
MKYMTEKYIYSEEDHICIIYIPLRRDMEGDHFEKELLKMKMRWERLTLIQ